MCKFLIFTATQKWQDSSLNTGHSVDQYIFNTHLPSFEIYYFLFCCALSCSHFCIKQQYENTLEINDISHEQFYNV